MNSLKNSVRLMGFLGNDPELRTFENERKLVRVSLATNESYKNGDGEWITDTQWHNLVMWDTQAAFADKNLEKGSEISVEGRLVNRSYTDRDGVRRFFTEVVVNKVLSMTRKNKAELVD